MKDNQKKIVVTGASGFLGRHLVDRLKTDEDFVVYALSSKGKELQKNNRDSRVICCHKDAFITDDQILRHSIIVNCAFPRNSTGIGMADGLRYIQQLFDCAVDSGAEAIINISSQSVYSQQRTEAATEETPVCLESPYAVGKYATELMLESACRGSKTKYTNLRMASLIGPGFDQRIVNRFVKQACLGETLNIVISNQLFGFLDIEDAVSAIMALFCNDISWRPVYTVGNGERYSVKEIADNIEFAFREEGLVFPEVDKEYDNKSGMTAVDYHQISLDTGFKPRYSLRETIHRILTTFKS